ncbi:MAG: GNAT family N-acetyltransferase [Anaerolineae bacterium]|nr:GNAT family N-acetyltransferase [Anaerolineae bacterium]
MSTTLTGYRYTWWRGDTLPILAPLADWHVEHMLDVPLLASLQHLYLQAIEARVRAGHRPYVAFLQGMPVAYGWVATRTERIAEGLEWPLSAHDRSLWDFATLPAWRGQGIYPRLLQAILHAEVAETERFWIGHTLENRASRRGILKAGFQPTLLGTPTAQGPTRWVLQGDRERALADPMVRHLNIRVAGLADGEGVQD